MSKTVAIKKLALELRVRYDNETMKQKAREDMKVRPREISAFGKNNKFESFYSWLDEFVFHSLALIVFGEIKH